MTVTVFLIILTICSAVTSIATEGVKKALNQCEIKYSYNLLVLLLALIIGCGTCIIYCIENNIGFTLLNCIYIGLMGFANWLGAMVGYDKVKQTIVQMVTAGDFGEEKE